MAQTAPRSGRAESKAEETSDLIIREDSVTGAREVSSLDDNETKTPPVATLQHLRAAIPKHCFYRSAWTSAGYILSDVSLLICLVQLGHLIPTLDSAILRLSAWTIYGFVQGLVCTGIWIIAHECGHRALFRYDTTNDAVGFVLHTFLLVPYFSWKYSHANHHRYTNHMEKDTAFVPHVADVEEKPSLVSRILEVGEDAPITSFISLFGHQLIGWPMYLFTHITAGPRGGSNDPSAPEHGWLRNHFNPWSKMFTPRQRLGVFLSDLGILATLLALMYAVKAFGAQEVLLLYGLPYLWVNHWIGRLLLGLNSRTNR
jgi:bifunctional Delta-12/omega-3 fatty acid desaturase